MHPVRNCLAIGATLLGLGCASTPAPTEQLASAEASVRAARELGAARVPRAKLHLNLAQNQVTRARQLSSDGDNERASVVLTRARADAELAVALTREAAVYQDLSSGSTRRETSMGGTTPTYGPVR